MAEAYEGVPACSVELEAFKSVDQLLGQAEIDVVGISYGDQTPHVYGIDVALHEAGLQYGSKDETVARVIKKLLRTAMCLHGYFGFESGTVIFTSPKINSAVYVDLMRCMDDMRHVLARSGMPYEVRVIGNEDFADIVLDPVMSVLDEVADTSELFMRSMQMYNLFSARESRHAAAPRTRMIRAILESALNEPANIDVLKEMKIGAIVRTILRRMLEEGKVPKEEIERLQSKQYSRETFHIQYPLLLKRTLTDGRSPLRYYSAPLRIYGEEYYFCSEWYEVPANNDRPYLMKWLGLHM
ncbi:hypothetical protein [Paenibacillus sp. YYML68]|uniref:hypothetical protein n=1 Tax=Paenibacillus sp. YYML68 TaxID=2909250 RepID=UPI0024921F03|nr:hypothetical protein [Paenibacillus sp. YYML68]